MSEGLAMTGGNGGRPWAGDVWEMQRLPCRPDTIGAPRNDKKGSNDGVKKVDAEVQIVNN